MPGFDIHIFYSGMPKGPNIAHMKNFDVFLGEKSQFLYKINYQKGTILERELL